MLVHAQPKLGKVSNAVKADLERALKDAKDAIEGAALEEEIEADKIDLTLPA